MLVIVATAAAVLFVVQAFLVAALSAARPRANIYRTIVVVAVVTAPQLLYADRLVFGRPLSADGRLFLVLAHLALGGFLFHFITLPDRSVTLRILVELYLAPGRRLSVGALRARYNVRAMIASRLAQLAEGQFIAIAPDGSLALRPRGTGFGSFVTGGRRLFRIASAN